MLIIEIIQLFFCLASTQRENINISFVFEESSIFDQNREVFFFLKKENY